MTWTPLDLTSFTETDPQSRATVTSTQIDIVNVEPDDNVDIYYNMGANNIGDFG